MQAVDEEHDLVGWRTRQFERLGVAYPAALELALLGVDWHRFKELVESGCPPELAAQILS